MPKPIDLTGQKFGLWTLIERKPLSDKKKRYYVCRCDCGTVKDVEHSGLVRGASQSCGCKEFARGKHLECRRGRSTREYVAWQNMRARCRNPNNPEFCRYGGRGITVCDAWQSFPAFLADMGRAPPRSSIERIDNSRGYTPDNCRWATSREQTRNTRRNVNIELNGKAQCLADWAGDLGISTNNLRWRLNRWPAEKALTQPARRRHLGWKVA